MKKIAIFDSGVETPEEIIMAAGLVPYRLFGDPTLTPEKANEHLPATHCLWTRNLLEQALNGLDENILGIIGTHGCDRTNREFDIWLECIHLDFMYFLNSPRKRDKLALKFFIDDINEMIIQFEEKLGIKIESEKIREAIKITNQIRNLLKEISEFRNNLIISGSEFHALVKLSQQRDKKEVIELLQQKKKELIERAPIIDPELKKILLTGSDVDDTEFIKYLEELGFQVVIDDLCVGTKYFWETVDENDDPINALAKYHLSKPIYSTKFPSYERFEILKDFAQNYKVDGVINIAQKFCEPILYNHPFMSKKFKEINIPYLFIESTYNRESYKQLATRISAFAEII